MKPFVLVILLWLEDDYSTFCAWNLWAAFSRSLNKKAWTSMKTLLKLQNSPFWSHCFSHITKTNTFTNIILQRFSPALSQWGYKGCLKPKLHFEKGQPVGTESESRYFTMYVTHTWNLSWWVHTYTHTKQTTNHTDC